MGRLTNIKFFSSGDPKQIAQTVRAPLSFQILCDSLTVRAYKKLLKKKVHRPDWKEDTFTLNFKPIIEELCVDANLPIQVLYQEPQLTPSLFNGTDNPNKAKRMDLVFSQFARPQNIKYGIEAKIVTSVNVGSRNAKRLCNEYIVSGMDRFINGNYNMPGSMVGYLVGGNTEDTVKLINECLCQTNRSPEIIKERYTLEKHSDCYLSYHNSRKMNHFIFEFL